MPCFPRYRRFDFHQWLPSSSFAAVAGLTLLSGVGINFVPSALASDWPRFRGPNGSGTSDAAHLPVEFGPKTNLAWRIESPPGSSSPVVAGNRVLLAGFEGDRRLTWCIDLKSGRRLWEQAVNSVRFETTESATRDHERYE